MGKAKYRGLAKPDDPLFSMGPEVFSPVGFKPSTTSSAKDTDGGTPVRSTSADDPNRPETEEDGIREEAIRREKVRRLSPGYRKSKQRQDPTRD